jgi:restriction system protein
MDKPKVWCVRANNGEFADAFVAGGYAALGSNAPDLTNVTDREQIRALLRDHEPDLTNAYALGQAVGTIARFRLEIQAGDIVVTPGRPADLLFWGEVQTDPYFYAAGGNGCLYRHRIKVQWNAKPVQRSLLSVPIQSQLRSTLTVFAIDPPDELLRAIGKPIGLAPPLDAEWHEVVVRRILELDPREFEILTAHLLAALGFEGTEVTGKPGDGGVDAVGELDVKGFARIKLFVQAKRYKPGTRISARVVRDLRAAIPRDGQGAFVTTSDFERAAHEVALDPMFPRIGLINGRQLVELLVEHWADLPEEFRRKLGLRPGLVPLAG